MGTLIKMKAEVNNPVLPVITEQGILPYYTGIYVNRLAEKGVTLTQTEINVVTSFVNSLIDANIIDKIGTFYPFMGNVNVPLIGDKELDFTDVSSANTNLDFVSGKLRGIKGNNVMPNVKVKDLTEFTKGFILGGSMITKLPTTHPSGAGVFVGFLGQNNDGTYPAIQARLQYASNEWRFRIFDLINSGNSSITVFAPTLTDSDVQDNYSFVYGEVNVNYSSEPMTYNRTLIKNNTVIGNVASNDLPTLLKTTDITEYYLSNPSDNQTNRVVTTLVFFNEILTAPMSKAFCQALDTFTDAVGKTV